MIKTKIWMTNAKGTVSIICPKCEDEYWKLHKDLIDTKTFPEIWVCECKTYIVINPKSAKYINILDDKVEFSCE